MQQVQNVITVLHNNTHGVFIFMLTEVHVYITICRIHTIMYYAFTLHTEMHSAFVYNLTFSVRLPT